MWDLPDDRLNKSLLFTREPTLCWLLKQMIHPRGMEKEEIDSPCQIQEPKGFLSSDNRVLWHLHLSTLHTQTHTNTRTRAYTLASYFTNYNLDQENGFTSFSRKIGKESGKSSERKDLETWGKPLYQKTSIYFTISGKKRKKSALVLSPFNSMWNSWSSLLRQSTTDIQSWGN